MPMPSSVVKMKKGNVEFISNVERANYTIEELSRAALKDVAKVVRIKMLDKLSLLPGMKKAKRKGGRLANSTQYWVRKKDADLQIGFKHNTWYGVDQELGTKSQPKRAILRDTVFENVDLIQQIEAKYLSAIEDEMKAMALIDEGEAKPDE